MPRDPIVDEARSARQKIFDACNEDLGTLLNRFQEQEKVDRDRFVSDLTTQPKPHAKRQNRVRPQQP